MNEDSAPIVDKVIDYCCNGISFDLSNVLVNLCSDVICWEIEFFIMSSEIFYPEFSINF